MDGKHPLDYETPSPARQMSAIAKRVIGALGAIVFAAAFGISIKSPYAPSAFEWIFFPAAIIGSLLVAFGVLR